MKKKILISSAITFVLLLSLVTSIHEIEKVETKNLVADNGVCEYYEKVFEIGEKDDVMINGQKVSMELTKIEQENQFFYGYWKLNDYEGIVKNDDFFTRNENKALSHVKSSFNTEGDSETTKSIGFDEAAYYTVDCTDGYNKQF